LQIPLKEGTGGERRPKDRVKTVITDNSIIPWKFLYYTCETSKWEIACQHITPPYLCKISVDFMKLQLILSEPMDENEDVDDEN
jgi:hypothetical protein